VIPSFLSIVTVTVIPAGPPVSIVGQTITIDFGTLTPTDSYTVTIATVVNSSATPPGGSNDVILTTTSTDSDSANNFDSVRITILGDVPETGFAAGRVTLLPRQPESKAFQQHADLWLEIPSLGVETDIVGIPLLEDGWDVRWLWDQAGYLNGTAFPTWSGNSVITGHVFLPSGRAGPFASLRGLQFGEEVIVHAWGLEYVYEIRSVHYVLPDDASVFEHREESWVTLVTCYDYDSELDAYRLRVAAKAVLVSIGEEQGPNSSDAEPSARVVQTENLQID
jgi:LPXTG-site transpeptidase (sortase) family protein